MNKRLIWGIVAVIVVVIVLILIFGGDNDEIGDGSGNTGDNLEGVNSENAADLQDSDDVFNELDNSLEFVE